MELLELCDEDGCAPPANGLWSGWAVVMAEIHGRIAHRFARAEVGERVRYYLLGLLERVERQNRWQLAEVMGESGPHSVQRLLNGAVWDAGGVREEQPGRIEA